MSMTHEAFSQKENSIEYVCGIGVGSHSCSGCIMRPDKSIVIKPTTFVNSKAGWKLWEEKLSQLGVPPHQVLIGVETISHLGEDLYRKLEESGYLLHLLRPKHLHQPSYHQDSRVEINRPDAMVIAEILLSGKAQIDWIQGEQTKAYWHLASLYTQLCNEATVCQTEIRTRVSTIFPEFIQIFEDPCMPGILQVLRAYPGASEVIAAGTEAIAQMLAASFPLDKQHNHLNAQKLVELARINKASLQEDTTRQSVGLRILCDQLELTQTNITRLHIEIEDLFVSKPQQAMSLSLPESHAQSNITIDPDHADLFGTTRLEYKLWIDYIFDWFGATLERRFRRYMVAACLALIVWLSGFILSLSIGFAKEYISTPAIYYFCIGIGWCSNALRWLSQVYHIRTNEVRRCFPVDDKTYKLTVSPFAQKAVRNKRIFVRASIFLIPVLIYFGIIMLKLIVLSSSFALGFPPSFPIYWLTGNFLLVKWIIIAILMWVAYIEAYTGVQLTLSTAPLYTKLASLPVLPLPSLVSESFRGVLNLYLTGAVMWSFGVVLVELLYNARADVLGLGFLAVVIGLGIFAYFAPLEAVKTIWRKAKRQAIEDAISADFYEGNLPSDPEKLNNINTYIQTLNDSEPGRFNITQLISFIFAQLLPVLPIVINTSLSGFSLITKIGGR